MRATPIAEAVALHRQPEQDFLATPAGSLPDCLCREVEEPRDFLGF